MSIDSLIEDMNGILEDVESKKEEGKFADESAVKKLLAEADEIHQQMNVSVHEITNKNRKQEVIAQIRNYRKQIDDYNHVLLVGGARKVAKGDQAAQSQDSLDKLQAARQQLHETQQIANDTMQHLAKQRETIARSRENTKEIKAELSRSDNMLTKMGKWWRG